MQVNVNSLTQQPIPKLMIDTIRNQLKENILASVKTMIDEVNDRMHQYTDTKIEDVNKKINNSKKAMYARK